MTRVKKSGIYNAWWTKNKLDSVYSVFMVWLKRNQKEFISNIVFSVHIKVQKVV
jgi:hypothetical protein